jgi:ferredoxin
MLKILKLIAGNLFSEKATVRLPDMVPTPDLFRGAVTLDPEKCIGCGMCAYVCVSNAVTGSDEEKSYAWAYEPGRCTFCARCVDRCPGHALHMDSAQVPCYEHHGERSAHHQVIFHACTECGEPVRLASDELLKLAFDHVKDETRELVRLCERCRRRRLQRKMIASAFVDNKENQQ